ncbi:MAG: PilW family protein [Lachnospiraceae bacterium]
MIFRGKNKKLNNKGFSLVEILVAMAILGVVSLAIYSFMNTGARLYQKTSSDADIQTEAQLVANSISDLIIDCEINISYGPTVSDRIPEYKGTVSGSGLPGGSNPDADNILEIDNNNYQFLIIPDGENLFYLERRAQAGSDVYEAYDLSKAQLLAENVTDFSVDLSRVTGKSKNIVTFSLTYERGGRRYSGNYQVNLRNSVSVNQVVDKVVDKNASITKIIVSPDIVYVDVKGKDNPQTVPPEKTQTFIASSDARNVTTQKLYTWSIASGYTGATITSGADDKSCTIKFDEYLYTDPAMGNVIPSSFNVTATSTINNPQTGAPVTGVATVYYRKILDMSVVPSRGVDKSTNTVAPETTALFTAEISDYNLSAGDKLCNWTLQYRTAGKEWAVCNDAGIAKLGTAGSSAYVTLGSNANEKYEFRLTAVSRWDGSWDASYEFGVAEVEESSGADCASRGVEIDLTAMYKAGKLPVVENWVTTVNNVQLHVDKIIGIELNNFSGNDTLKNLMCFSRDGKAYMYLDYASMRYTEGREQLTYYGNGQNVSVILTCLMEDGVTIYTQTANFNLDPVRLLAGKPTDGSTILIDRGSGYNMSFSTTGYNISKKNQIGIYVKDSGADSYMNANANEYGMIDANNYIDINYISSLGNRYNYVDKGVVRLTAKTGTDFYPKDSVNFMITIEDYYKTALAFDTSHLANCSYTFDAYVSNVEGASLFIAEPSYSGLTQNGDGSYQCACSVKAVSKTGADGAATIQELSANTGTDITLSSGEVIQFNVVVNNNTVSYFTLSYNGGKYYYNSTYHCWKKMS